MATELHSAQEIIARALAPGVAVTALVLYNSGLQNRFIQITGRLRELNREARNLSSIGMESNIARLESLLRQVCTMRRRTRMLRRAVLFVYLCFGLFVATIFCLAGSLRWPALDSAALYLFVTGFGVLGGAAALSAAEMYLALETVDEDVQSSFEISLSSKSNDCPRPKHWPTESQGQSKQMGICEEKPKTGT